MVRKGISLFKVFINETLDLKVSLLSSLYPNIFFEGLGNLGANFVSKMSKLLEEVRREDREVFAQTYICP